MANVWENAVLTNKGVALQAKTLAGEKIKITSAKAGAGTVSAATLMAQTKVSDIRQTLSIKPVQYVEKTAILTALLTNTGLKEAYDLRQVGFYAMDPDEGEILFAIAQNTEARHVPSEEEVPGYSLMWNFHFSLSNGTDIDAVVNPAGFVTEENLEDRLARMNMNTIRGEITAATGGMQAPLFGMKVFGKSKQITTTGAQLLNTKNHELGSYSELDGTVITHEEIYRFNDAIPVTEGETLYISKQVVIVEFAEDGSFIRQYIYAGTSYTVPAGVATIKVRTFVADFDTFLPEDYMISREPILEWEEFSGEKPSPSPEYQQEVESIESPVVKVYGKNLLKSLSKEQTFKGITFSPHGEGGIKVSGTSTESVALVLEYITPVIGEYTLSGSTTNTRVVARLVHKNGASDYHTSFNGSIVTFEITEDIREYNVYVEVKGGLTVNDEYMHPMLKLREVTDATYEAYKEPMTLPLPYTLRGIPVESGGNYTDAEGQEWICDEIDLERGVYIKRVSDKVYLSEFTTWAESTVGANYSQYMARVYEASNFESCFCNSFGMINREEREEKTGIVKYPDGHVRVSLLNSVGIESLEEFATWIEEIGAYIHYILLEPVETALTAEEIDTYRSFYTYAPVTTFKNVEGATIEVKYANSELGALIVENRKRSKEIDKKYANLSNPNLLINGDFQVWQRGESFKNVANQFTADRWYVVNVSAQTPVIEKVTLTNRAQGNISTAMLINETKKDNTLLKYSLENIAYGKNTLSLYVNGNAGNSIKVAINTDANIVKTVTLDGAWQRVTVQCEDISKIYLIFDGGLTYVTGVKLEQGTIATPFVPRSHAEELAMCKYFYLRSRKSSPVFYSYSNKKCSLQMDYEAMRTTPTVKSAIASGNDTSGNGNLSTDYVVGDITRASCALIFTFDKDRANGQAGIFVDIQLDAEIY